MSAYNFVVDSALLEEVKEKCITAANAIIDEEGKSGYIVEIFKIIRDDMSQHWGGTSYTTFKESCESYEDSIKQLGNVLRAYAKLIENVYSEDDALIALENQIKSALGGGGSE